MCLLGFQRRVSVVVDSVLCFRLLAELSEWQSKVESWGWCRKTLLMILVGTSGSQNF
jgi:hypothetical protein